MADSAFRKRFRVFSDRVSDLAGSPVVFGISVGLFLVWLALGPYFKWSDAHRTWLDMVLALTPFWMVFILQATQNRDSDIIEAKLDVLLKAIDKAQEDLVGIQRRPHEEVKPVARVRSASARKTKTRNKE
jgi:low affinity Fe/Cu permease